MPTGNGVFFIECQGHKNSKRNVRRERSEHWDGRNLLVGQQSSKNHKMVKNQKNNTPYDRIKIYFPYVLLITAILADMATGMIMMGRHGNLSELNPIVHHLPLPVGLVVLILLNAIVADLFFRLYRRQHKKGNPASLFVLINVMISIALYRFFLAYNNILGWVARPETYTQIRTQLESSGQSVTQAYTGIYLSQVQQFGLSMMFLVFVIVVSYYCWTGAYLPIRKQHA